MGKAALYLHRRERERRQISRNERPVCDRQVVLDEHRSPPSIFGETPPFGGIPTRLKSETYCSVGHLSLGSPLALYSPHGNAHCRAVHRSTARGHRVAFFMRYVEYLLGAVMLSFVLALVGVALGVVFVR